MNYIKLFKELKAAKYSREDFFNEYGNPPEGLLVDQKGAELKILIEILKNHKPTNILEVGQYDGGTMYYLQKYSQPGARIIGLDIDHSRYKLSDSEKTKLVTADSSLDSTREIVKKLMPSIDFLFIDGYHLSPIVDKDYEHYGSLVKKGIIAFHDINWIFDPKQKGFDPARSIGDLWLEIKAEHPADCVEFIQDPQPAPLSYGIGVIAKGTTL